MGKKAVTWKDVIREQFSKLRKDGKKPSFGDVVPYAKKEWEEIKAGTHPLYIQGSSKGMSKGSSKGSNKSTSKSTSKSKRQTKKNKGATSSSTSTSNNSAIQHLLANVKLCKKDQKQIHKYLQTQKGGSACGMEQTGGSDCGCDQTGGKRKKNQKTRKMKKMKGGDKESYVSVIDEKSGQYTTEDNGPESEEVADELV